MFQVKWINYGIPGTDNGPGFYKLFSDALSMANVITENKTGATTFAWVEPVFLEPEPRRLEWEDVMGQAPEPETRTITQETLAMLDRYVADKATCPMDPIARTQEAVSRLVESGHVYPEAYLGDEWVEIISAGYEFRCPECDQWNSIETWTKIVQCEYCCTTFRSYQPDNAYE